MSHTYIIERDEDPMPPSDWSDESLFIVAFHRDFTVTVEGLKEVDDSVAWYETHWILPLFAYIHSGVSLSLAEFSDQWDSCRVGSVLISRECGPLKEAVERAEALVVEWNQFLSGDVWGYMVFDEDGHKVDACWGFYGEEYACSEAQRAIKEIEDGEVPVMNTDGPYYDLMGGIAD